MFANKTPEIQNTLVDQAAASADQAIRSTQRVANEALEGLAGSAQDLRERAAQIPEALARYEQDLRERAAPMVDRVADRASAMAHHGVDAVRARSHQLSESAHRVADGTRNYVREEPGKSLLIAAFTGAALMALLAFLGRSRRRG